ncbi:MAG: hypothetical protein QOK43_2623 [Acidimicrobiaceae bacterium]|nr:hypothetical protein [Acidimicrobiaceae bacterium]
MSTNTTSLRRVVTFICGVAVGLFLLTGVASAAPKHDTDTSSPQPASNADYSGHGANQHGSYDSTRDGSPSGNGNGGGEAKGKPCAGCVGKADNKNPKGQAPGGSDHNNGYECDGNHGVGRSNPAHTGCRTGSTGSGSTGTGSTGSGTTGSGSTGSTHTPPPVVGGTEMSGGHSADDAPKPATECAGGQMAVDANGDGVIDSRDCIVTQVEGVGFERADIAPAGAASGAVLASAETRGGGGSGTAVMGAQAVRGSAALPLTGAGADLLTLALAAVALLGTGTFLVRRSRAAAA